ncbi:hypothetical protein LCGC14_2264630 [marine sediment metagenome]|uniref:Uncharacterized protein n=1 Tax=marine sediment metagenome TaxID=412755 RepID=A0A0F9DKW9_9ZZZZ|nr:hypothetical protein [bacterium]
MKRQYISYTGWDRKTTKIPIPKGGYWWNKTWGNGCVVGCKNGIECFYISKKGLASIGYCMAHAELRILKSIISGFKERGTWHIVEKGMLKPHYFYKYETKYMLDHLKDPKKYKKRLQNIRMMIKK